MMYSLWDGNNDTFVKYNYNPSEQVFKEYEDSLTNRDLLRFITPFCNNGDLFKYSEDYEMSLDKKSFLQLYSYNPERFREIALDYLMFKCKQKPLADDMKEYFRTYAEIDYGNNHE